MSYSKFDLSLLKRAAWGGVDADHPFEILSNPDQVPPLLIAILTLILFGFFFLSNLPRGGELFNGIKLSRKPPSPSPNVLGGGIALAQTPITARSRASTFVSTSLPPPLPSSSQEGVVGVGSPTYPSPTYQTPDTATPLRSFNNGSYPSQSTDKLIKRTNPPKSFPSLSSFIPLGHYLDAYVPFIGYTLGQTFVCLLWAGLTALGLFYNCDVVTETVRSGFVATNQLPIVFLLAGKVNWIGYLVGKGYEKLNFLHRIAATFHAGGYLVKWMKKGGIAYVSEASQKSFITAGIVAWAAFAFIGVTSIPIIRRRMYALFWASHWIGFVTAIIALSFHKPYTGLFATICLLLYTKDLILRLILKTRIVPARIVALPAPSSDLSSGSTQIVLPLRSGWRAGQHVFIRIPALREVGGLAWLENHPFTIGSGEGGELVLIVKKAGDWTRNLYDFALRDLALDMGMVERVEQVLGRGCKVLVEGPYGGPCSTVFASFSGIMLIAGGSGITYSLGMFEDVIRKAEEGHLRASTVHFVWAVKTYEDALSLLSHLEDLNSRARNTTFKPLITVYLSRSFRGETFTQGSIRIVTERPDLPTIVREGVSKTRMDSLSYANSPGASNRGLIVGICGPRRLIDGTNLAVRSVSWKEKKDIGGITVS
ncbi:hypothetical protein L486_02634 [Kwoniella mangroviensis CBS 10435]|uniref:ferric-chelate reductase (NADPH) n=1 Tax=Kwoniella mangroviensis CBS 10435 TaxID=1331196 RepID=A0A1B9IWQ9_9TREE|nr:hypothetical protein L486_02634 [Kwoniella mangroviensis CBS 10435]